MLVRKRSLRKKSIRKRSITKRSITKRSLRKKSIRKKSIRKRSIKKRSIKKKSIRKRSLRNRSIFDGAKKEEELNEELNKLYEELKELFKKSSQECEICTYKNKSKSSKCEICEQELPVDKIRKKINELKKKLVELEEKITESSTKFEEKITESSKKFEEEKTTESKYREIEISSVNLGEYNVDFSHENLLKIAYKPDFTKNVKMLLLKLLENKYQYINVRGDGYCSLYAVMMAYLCIEGKEFLEDVDDTNKLVTIDNMEKLRNFLKKYIKNEYKNMIEKSKKPIRHIRADLKKVDDLLKDLTKLESMTVVSEILFEILCTLLQVNITVYEISQNKIEGVVGVSGTITNYQFDPRKSDEIRIFTNGCHYFTIADKNLTVKNLSKDAETWRGNMYDSSSKPSNFEKELDF